MLHVKKKASSKPVKSCRQRFIRDDISNFEKNQLLLFSFSGFVFSFLKWHFHRQLISYCESRTQGIFVNLKPELNLRKLFFRCYSLEIAFGNFNKQFKNNLICCCHSNILRGFVYICLLYCLLHVFVIVEVSRIVHLF